MYRKILIASIISLAALSFAGCAGPGNDGDNTREMSADESLESEEAQPSSAKSDKNRQEPGKRTLDIPESEGKESDKKTETAGGKMTVDFEPGFQIAGDEYKPLAVTAKAPEYTVSADLSNIENLDQFSNLTETQKTMIARNGFVVTPTDSEQLFYVYEDNTYKKVPSFVSADSVLQLYHIFYDYSLRSLEGEFFYKDLTTLNNNMFKQLMAEYGSVNNETVKENIYKMIGYFGVAELALGNQLPADFPAELKAAVNEEYALITAASENVESPLFGIKIDYTLFQVRGHYSRSEELGKYFRAMSWYGTIPIPFYSQDGKKDEDSAMRAIVTAVALCRLPEESGGKLWENIYSATCFYVGEADDITPYEVAKAVEKVYSDTPDLNEIPKKLDAFYKEVESMRQAEIVLKIADANTKPQMRFMGQRYIPDSEIMQELSEEYARPFPCGVDVFAVFGSERAGELLDEIYKPNQLWKGYQENFDLLSEKFQSQTIPEQTQNLYSGWLYSLKSLTNRVGAGYPYFMQNTAWEDKSLATALGSWAEIRHDTILYGKQSGTECGGGNEPPELVGYVEPNPEFFNRLLWLTTATRENLGARGLLNESMQYKLEQFEDMLDFLKTCALKELNGENLSSEEQYTILTFGGTLEYLSSSIAEADGWYLVESDTDRNMAVIADVHTASGLYLEVGVGTAAEMYVAIPQNGKVYLTRGAVFDYYEFTSNERLTDEAWQEKLKKETIERPPFVDSFMDDIPGREVPVPDEPYSTGC